MRRREQLDDQPALRIYKDFLGHAFREQHMIGVEFPLLVVLDVGGNYLDSDERVNVVRVVLPPLGNFVIGLLKDTALASAVAAPELMFRARSLVDKTFLATQIFVTAGVIYLAMSLPLGYLTRLAEARVARGRR